MRKVCGESAGGAEWAKPSGEEGGGREKGIGRNVHWPSAGERPSDKARGEYFVDSQKKGRERQTRLALNCWPASPSVAILIINDGQLDLAIGSDDYGEQ